MLSQRHVPPRGARPFGERYFSRRYPFHRGKVARRRKHSGISGRLVQGKHFPVRRKRRFFAGGSPVRRQAAHLYRQVHACVRYSRTRAEDAALLFPARLYRGMETGRGVFGNAGGRARCERARSRIAGREKDFAAREPHPRIFGTGADRRRQRFHAVRAGVRKQRGFERSAVFAADENFQDVCRQQTRMRSVRRDARLENRIVRL